MNKVKKENIYTNYTKTVHLYNNKTCLKSHDVVCQFCTLHSDGEVAGAAVSCRIRSCVLDQSLSYWEHRAWSMATGHCEATT